MTNDAVDRRILQLFADILEYPRTGLTESARKCAALMASKDAQTGALLAKFQTFVEGNSVERMQEVYSTTFDLNATYHPYVGYHLLGETYKRSAFLLQLKEHYQAQGFVADEKELPDHLVVVLRYLSVSNDGEMTEELVREALVPALKKMLKENKKADSSDQTAGSDESDCSANCGRMPEFKSAEAAEDAEEGKKRTRRTGPYRNVLKALRNVLQQQYPADKEVGTYV